MEELIITGVVEHIVYANEDNGYTVFSLLLDDNSSEDTLVCCVGFLPGLNIGENLRIVGKEVKHPSYGDQLEVVSYEKSLPVTAKAIERYLAGGIIKGIGKRMAKRIVDKFGEETFNIIDQQPQLLADIKGISLNKAQEIGAVFKEQGEMTTAIMFLQKYGISITYATKIFKKYKGKTIDIIQKNPYALADEIWGIGFKTADNIARQLGIEPDSPYRIKAGIKYLLNHAGTANGHTFLPANELIYKAGQMLNIDASAIEESLMSMHIESQVWIENSNNENGTRKIYLNFFYYAESYIAKRLVELTRLKEDPDPSVDAEIAQLESEYGLKFASQQLTAIKTAMQEGVLVITGGPGTGKTTIINAIINLMEQYDLKIELAAPTGKASKRMTEATGHEARTIHRLLGVTAINEGNQHQSFTHNEEDPIDADCIIIDEVSMVDEMLMYYLLKAVARDTRLILVGDADQLPSVGAGNVLKDIINSEIVPSISLNEIFRQAEQSAIVTNAHKINRGEYPDLADKTKDFFYMQRTNYDLVISTLKQLISERLPKYLECDPMDIKVLTPMRKSPLGVYNLNTIMQEILNPPSITKQEKEFRGVIYREGDKVMQIKNNYELSWKIVDDNDHVRDDGVGVFNGDEGIITYIDNENKYLEVMYDGCKYVAYDFTNLDELELAYAVTIHKSQGSEYRAIIMPLLGGPEMLMTKNLLYTGITRAKELAVLVGNKESIYHMVDNDRQINRYTGLSQRINDFARINA